MTTTEMFPMDVKEINKCIVMTPRVREITFKNTRAFLNFVKDTVTKTGAGPTRYVLDLKNIEIIDSVSLGTLVAVLKYVRSQAGELVVANVSDPINELFELLHFHSVFKIYPKLEDALN